MVLKTTLNKKICTKCYTEKPIEEFPWKNQSLNIKHTVCKTCVAKKSNSWYKKNRESHIQNVMSKKADERNIARTFIWEYLSTHPCVVCGENDPTVLEFDHINGKVMDVSRLVANGATPKRLLREINLCQVLCSNCHRRKTAKERNWFSGK
jgi:ribosomal protein L40E